MEALELTPYGPFVENLSLSKCDTIYDGKLSNQTLLFLAAGSTACLTSSLYNPLDCLRVRWQVLPATDPISRKGVMMFATRILRTEGLFEGLWRPGVSANALAMSSSAALRFGYYETFRDRLSQMSNGKTYVRVFHDVNEKRGSDMILAGLSCGAMAYFVTAPFHLSKTIIQSEKGMLGNDGLYLNGAKTGRAPYANKGALSLISKIVKDNGVRGLWKGSIPLSMRGALFTCGQMCGKLFFPCSKTMKRSSNIYLFQKTGYDGFKTFSKARGADDGPLLHIAASIVAAIGATVLSTPADFVMSRYISSDRSQSLSFIIKETYEKVGLVGFWRGSSICFARVAPVILTYSAVYEQLRLTFGLGYLT